jgi:hypothetical protein
MYMQAVWNHSIRNGQTNYDIRGLNMQVDIYMDYVMFCGQRINRPNHVSRSDWMRVWEQQIRGGFFGFNG